IGEVALPYGTPGEPHMQPTTTIGPDGRFDVEDARARAVTLRRDVQELRAGACLARGRCEAGATVLLLDGTLFPWDLDSNQVSAALRKEMEEQTRDALGLARTAGAALSMGAYVSGSRSGDVVTSLAAFAGPDVAGWPAADAPLFARLLADGQRSALFAG